MFKVRRDAGETKRHPRFLLSFLRSGVTYSLAIFVDALVRLAILFIGTRVLTVEDFGALDTTLFVVLVFSSTIVLGFDSAVLRFAFDEKEGTRHPARLLTTSVVFVGANGLLLSLFFAISLLFFNYSALRLRDTMLFVCIVFFGLGFSLTSVVGAHMRARFHETRFLAATSLSAFLRIGALVPLLVKGEASFSTFMLTISGTYFVSGIVFLVLNRHWLSLAGVDTGLMRRLFAFGLPLGSVVIIAGTYPLLERLIVYNLGGPVWLSIYAASAFPAMILSVAIQVVNLAWVPHAMNAVQEERTNFIRNSALLMQSIFIILYLSVLAFVEPIVRLLAPIDVKDAAQLFPFIGMIMLVRFSSLFTAFGLIVKKRTGVKFIINSFGFATGAFASFLAGERYGVGAIPVAFFLATLCTFLVEAVVARRLARQVLLPFPLMALAIVLTAIFPSLYVLGV